MIVKRPIGELFFDIIIYAVLIILALSCILPMIHVFAISLSSKDLALAGKVSFWPQDFTAYSYEFVVKKPDFFRAFRVSLLRVLIGVPLNMLLILITAFPLSKKREQLRGRTAYVWFFIVTMIFNGGLVPTYMTVMSLKLIDSIWALVLPGAVMVWNILLMMNFFRNIPPALEESAFVDGAGYITVLFRIYIPLSVPAMAAIGLFATVSHWNAWFDGLIYMNTPLNYPMQTYIFTIVNSTITLMTDITNFEKMRLMERISDKTVKSAVIFLAALPVLMLYPFLQRYFISGIVLGSVKE